ncbi:MAG TPA: cytochrome c biogenesis protein ResB, partial [Bacteroidales bacterium]|nr:cytochrome c biogenesis protein ResB [Bacteroidales bacterium]
MDRFVKFLTSRQLMGALFILLAAVLAVATFLENDFGYNASRAMVYNTWWFELIFVLLGINMFGNLFAFNLWRWRKAPVLLFHLAFFLIILGAAITRYIGYEGNMPIREGQTANTIYTTDAYVTLEVSDQSGSRIFHEKVFLSGKTPHEFSKELTINGKDFSVKTTRYTYNAMMRPIAKEGGDPLLGILASSSSGRQEEFLKPGQQINAGGLIVGFAPSPNQSVDVAITIDDDNQLALQSKHSMQQSAMGTQQSTPIPGGTPVSLKPGTIYSIQGIKLAMSRFWPEAELKPAAMNTQGGGSGRDMITFHISGENQNRNVFVEGKKGDVGEPENVAINGGIMKIRYGSLPLELPFSLRLNDFQLERYPGSESPSSYASEVTLIDPANNKKMDYRIFMNNILNYGGYRFYQSSYDRDEKGTILSVNHDFWGTLITYIGYFLLSISMLWSLFAKDTHFRKLLQKTNKIYQKRKGLATVLLVMVSISAFGQSMPPKPDKDVAGELGKLWVQDKGGR